MMHCDKCNVNISTKTTVCPLCGQPLQFSEKTVQWGPETGLSYPQNRKSQIRTIEWVNPVSLICVVILSVLAGIINIFAGEGAVWSLFAVSLIIFAYVVVRCGVVGTAYFPQNVLLHTATLGLVIATARSAFGIDWAFVYALPALFVTALIAVCIYMSLPKNRKNVRLFLFIPPALTVLSAVPLIVVLVEGTFPLVPLASFVLCLMTSFILIMSNLKKAAKELRRKINL